MSQHLTYNDQKISTGDTVRIHQEIAEGDKSRVQIFEGIVIAIKNAGMGKTMTIRKIGNAGIGVEKILPVMLPSIKKIEVKRQGQVRRAKVYYLRDRVGKAATRIKEKKTQFSPTETA
jgi:large subunit ribosomal protein L19